MPDLRLYAAAIVIAGAIAAAGSLLGLVPCGRDNRTAANRWNRHRITRLIWLALAVVAGWWTLAILPQWPPRNGLERLLVLALPAAVLLEFCLGSLDGPPPGDRPVPWDRLGRRIAWALFAAAFVPTLLYGSVHLQVASPESGSPHFALITRGLLGILLAIALEKQRGWLLRLERHTADGSVRVGLGLAVGATALLILFGGYLKGGAAALPLAAAILGGALPTLGARPTSFVSGDSSTSGNSSTGVVSDSGVVSVAVIALAGWLVVGTSFGNVGVWPALVTWLAPLLAAAPDWLGIASSSNGRRRLARVSLRIALVAAPLACVLTLAYREFEQKYRPFTQLDSRPPRDATRLTVNSGPGRIRATDSSQ
ncbi:MAG: hypothetical protein ACKO38_15795 [Planctomycetota bacterium]